MQSVRSASRLLSLACVAASSLVLAGSARAQALSKSDVLALVKTDLAVEKVRDSIYGQLAKTANKKDSRQTELRQQMVSMVADAIKKNGLTQQQYDHLTFAYAVDTINRPLYDSLFASVTGTPSDRVQQATRIKQQASAAPAGGGAAAPVKVPAGMAGTHIGHVINSGPGAPGGMGFLPAAIAEATTAAQHATLGARAPTDLAMMQLHAGHVINCLDPTILNNGGSPCKGYGVKKGAADATSHIELAAAAGDATANEKTHAAHVAAALRSTSARADSAIAIAKQIQAAKDAPTAAALMDKLVSVTQEIIHGQDVNKDGKIDWSAPEGGLDQAKEHVDLLLKGEGLPGLGG